MKKSSLQLDIRILAILVILGSMVALGACVPAEPASSDDSVTAVPESAGAVSNATENIDLAKGTSESGDDFETQGLCPLRWTCGGPYYGTKTQCIAACGDDLCYREPDCSGSCICP